MDGSVAIISIKSVPIGLHVMYLYFPDTPPIFEFSLILQGLGLITSLATGHQRIQPLRRNKHEMSDKIFHTLLKSNVH